MRCKRPRLALSELGPCNGLAKAIRFRVAQAPRRSFTVSAKRYQVNSRPRYNSTTWRPYLRIGLAFAFAGAFISSMATGGITKYDSPPSPNRPRSATTLAEVDEVTKRRTIINKYSPMRLRMEALIAEHQQRIVSALEAIDGKKFRKDVWSRPHGGGGVSCVLQ
jgi:coproporphyrinogen III oxidase